MKKVLYLIGLAVAMLTANTAKAQFDHLSAGLELGTSGYGIELATNATPYLSLRTGLTTMPRISYADDVNYTSHGNPEKVEVKGTAHISDFKLLADYYPFTNNSFHLTAGFFLGRSELLTAHNTEEIKGLDPGEGLEIGDVFVRPDENNIARANIKVNSFKPYLGIGFGRAISKHKINVACDLGVQFWGKPKLNAYSPDEEKWVRVHTNDVDEDDFNKALDKISGIGIYPVLNIRIYYNIF